MRSASDRLAEAVSRMSCAGMMVIERGVSRSGAVALGDAWRSVR
ncbi:hypothetical protein [Sandarakinorhabdus glacialis]|nr:hypothetical protein [Polymorphobacter glacialis]